MQTLRPTQEEMNKRIARFQTLKPRAIHHEQKSGIPVEVIRMLNPKANYVLMAPEDVPGTLSLSPAVVGGDKGVIRIGIAECEPGGGSTLHVHWKTHETFIALSGKWAIRWGDKGEENTVLEPYDLIAVPPKVTRQFINISENDAHLLVIIQGEKGDFNDLGRSPEAAIPVIEKYGQGMIDKLVANGWTFSLDANAPEDSRK